MPYTAVQEGEKWKVYKKGPDGKPTGKALGTHPDEKSAQNQIGAIELNEKAMPEMLTQDQQGKKSWGDTFDDDYHDYAMPMGCLMQDDSRVNYDPIGGLVGGTNSADSADGLKACANCTWFKAHCAGCTLVSGPIVATGVCDLWLATREYKPEPIPVVIVNNSSQTITASSAAPGRAEQKESSKQAENTKPHLLAGLRAFLGGFVSSKSNSASKEAPSKMALTGFKALPDMHWIALYTNNAKDRQGEIFAEKAHDEFIGRLDAGAVPMPELWFWHIPGRIGQAEWVDRVGHVVMAEGTFDNTPVGRKFYEHYRQKEDPDGTSHGYLYFTHMRDADGIYWDYNTFEISPLPPLAAANEYTSFEEVKEMAMPITEQKKAALEVILGKELAAQYLAQAEQKSKELDDLGVKFKEGTAPDVTDTSAREAIKQVAEAQTLSSKQMSEGLKALTEGVNTLNTAIKAIADGAKATDERLKKLEIYAKEQEEFQPAGSKSMFTMVPNDSPLVQAMKQADKGQIGQKSILDYVLEAAGVKTDKPEGEVRT
jgi:hypothetical protein